MAYVPGRDGLDIKIYYDTLCRINSIPITLYHSQKRAMAMGGEAAEEKENFLPGYSLNFLGAFVMLLVYEHTF